MQLCQEAGPILCSSHDGFPLNFEKKSFWQYSLSAQEFF
jgi:hypothetical protein